jgi:hypothetical protein
MNVAILPKWTKQLPREVRQNLADRLPEAEWYAGALRSEPFLLALVLDHFQSEKGRELAGMVFRH